MASILRSSKFVRYVAGFAKNIVVGAPREFDGNLANTSQCLCNTLPRSLTTQASTQHDLDRSLKRLDQDVRRAGRISRRDIEDVLEEIRTARAATSSQSLLVIRCCGNLVPEELPETRTKLVEEIWNTLLKLNVPMDISHYNALLRVYLENEHLFSPTEFLSNLEAKGIEPNRVTYQRLIARYCQIGDIEGATRILEFMREKQMPVNENVFNALIMGHSQSGDMESAQGILSVMVQAGLEPSADTYTTLLCGYAKQGDIEKVTKLFDECDSKEIYLLDKDMLDIVYAFAINGNSQHVPVILNRLRKAFGYNQDAINLILRLINKGQEDSAFLILKSMPRATRTDGSLAPSGVHFIKQLVKAERPLEKIVELCEKLEKEQLYDRGILLATETSLQLTKEELAYSLLKELQVRGHHIRPHFFWPLIISKADDPTGDGIVNVLIQMNNFNIVPNTETIRDYVIPNMKGKSSEIIAKLRQANISIGSSACSLMHCLLQQGNIEEASVIVTRVNAYYNPILINKALTGAFYKTKDLKSYITILRHVYENLDRRDTVIAEENKEPDDKNEVIGKLILDLTVKPQEFIKIAEEVLSALVEEGLSISTPTAEKLQEKLGEKLTPQVSSLLGKLTSGELTPVPIVKKPPAYTPSNQMNIPQLERLISNLEAKKQDVQGLKRQLLTLYCREKELEKLESLLKELADSEFVYSVGVYAQLIDIYSYYDKLEESLNYYNKLAELEPGFGLDDVKVVRVAGLLLKNNRFDEAIKFLESQNRDRKLEDRTFAYVAQCWRLLNSVAEEGKTEELQKLFDTLVKCEYIEVNNVLLGPLIKVHLVNNELDKALEKFEWCCNQFKATPWKNELACKLIENEDAEKLQKLTDLSTSVHGEINSLYDLVFAFVECGRIRQARKILETPGLQNRPNRINDICQRYQTEGMVKPLEGLKDATKDLNHIDRSDIYYQLLLSYIKQDDLDKALGLWTQMQEEDIPPNDRFLNKLGIYLQEKGMVAPFQIPIIPSDQTVESKLVKKKSYNKIQRNDAQLFRQAIKAGEIDKALEMKRTASDLTTIDVSLLIENLVQSDRHAEATEMAMELLLKGIKPVVRVFRFLLNKLANIGDVESVELLGSKMDSEMKKLLSFDNKVCHANLVAGRAAEYLDKLEQEIDNAKPEDVQALGEKFPRGGALGILEGHSELEENYKNIAIKYAKLGVIAPLNILWAYYFKQGKDEEANQIWTEYLKDTPRIMFQRIARHARETSDDELVRKLLKHLQTATVTEGAIGNAYSCLLDILTANKKYDDVITTFEDALKDVGIDYLNRTAIHRTKEVYLMLGKTFDHKIPLKNNESSTSSTDKESERKK